ncbi:MAG: hypothetical protein IPG92_17265 [Flavobacteriales bacterium]|nr:hypothetical protein [Flavobacteriales bacterium]
MKKKLLFVALVALAFTTKGQGSGFGAGIMLGSPTGLSAKYWISGDRAIDGGLAWGVWRGSYIHLHADYLFHNMELLKVAKGKLPLYYGPGLRMRSWSGGRYWHKGEWRDYDGSYVDLGVRFPVGLAYLFDGAPVDVFVELVPTLDLIPATSFDLDAAIGARYWF